MLQLTLKPRRARAVRAGHSWIFRDDVINPPPEDANGAEADVIDHTGRYVGRGLVSAYSKIVCRLYSRTQQPLDRDFWRQRLLAAAELRRHAGLPGDQTDSFRLVFAEGDLLPGLSVDRLGDYLVVQTPTVGMDQRKPLLIELLDELFHPRGICERNDMPVRRQEGLPLVSGWLAGEPAETVRIRENGLRYEVAPLGMMKTGHFFDQRENRLRLAGRCQGRRVLDMFCFSGGFALAAAQHGAAEVLAFDSSEPAIAAARANAELNHFGAVVEFQPGDCFDVLRRLNDERRQFDLIVLDPPAFAKRKEHWQNAVRGYKQIQLRALKMLPVGGTLLACSCSFQVDRTDFREILHQAAADARVLVRIVAEGAAGADHPVLLNVPETEYLKSLLVEVVERY